MDGNIENSYAKKSKKPLIIAIVAVVVLLIAVGGFFGLKFFRDFRRKADYETLSKNISEIYMKNNIGSLPNETSSLDATTYINDSGSDILGNGYIILPKYCSSEDACSESEIPEPTAPSDSDGRIGNIVYVVSHATCKNNRPEYSSSNTAYAVYGYLDYGSYCYANES